MVCGLARSPRVAKTDQGGESAVWYGGVGCLGAAAAAATAAAAVAAAAAATVVAAPVPAVVAVDICTSPKDL